MVTTLRALAFALAAMLVFARTVADADTANGLLCFEASQRGDGHALDTYCVIAAAEQLDVANSTSDRFDAQTARLREATFLYLGAEGAMLTMQFKLGAAELAKSRAIFKDVRDHGLTRTIREKAVAGLDMIDAALYKLSHLGDQ